MGYVWKISEGSVRDLESSGNWCGPVSCEIEQCRVLSLQRQRK